MEWYVDQLLLVKAFLYWKTGWNTHVKVETFLYIYVFEAPGPFYQLHHDVLRSV